MKHGLSNTRLYRIWAGMKQRCYNTEHRAYRWYGAKGVTVCEEWKTDFKAFYDWALSNGYAEDLSIDRINNSLGYEPSNCQWITPGENALKMNRSRRASQGIFY